MKVFLLLSTLFLYQVSAVEWEQIQPDVYNNYDYYYYTEPGFDVCLDPEPVVKFQGHLWTASFLWHHPECPCRQRPQ